MEKKFNWRRVLVLLIGLTSLFYGGYVSAKEDPSTINILIDVSGSMKQNDPQNERIKAMKLLINLLPKGVEAGIWLFAENTQMIKETSTVNAKWKREGLKATKQIHSKGVYTDIEKAVNTVLQNGFKHKTKNNLILLTDGMVDISKDIMVSAESRERVIQDLIPKLQQQNVSLLTMALSENADKPLLSKLAFDTYGWAEETQSAEQLQKTFLKMFNRVAPTDKAPLESNLFTIDKSIKEFSLLLFKQDQAMPTRLITPDKTIMSSSSKMEQLSWVDEAGYDLITVAKPLSGDWIIEADMDPDNQLMILTDLKFQIEDTPAYLAENESLTLKAHFTEQGKLLRRDDFLQIVDIQALYSDAAGQEQRLKFEADAEKGYFILQGKPQSGTGEHRYQFIADGKTFKREIKRTIKVIDEWLKLDWRLEKADQLIITLTPNTDLLDADELTANATVAMNQGKSYSRDMKRKDGQLILNLPWRATDETAMINFSLIAKSPEGEPVTPTVRPLTIHAEAVAALHSAKLEAEQEGLENEVKAAGGQTEVKKNIDDEPEVVEETEETRWGVAIAIIVAVNLLIIGAGFFIFKWMKKQTAMKQEQLLGRLA